MNLLRAYFYLVFGVLAVLCGGALLAGMVLMAITGGAVFSWPGVALVPGTVGMCWVGLGWLRRVR